MNAYSLLIEKLREIGADGLAVSMWGERREKPQKYKQYIET